jgi:putative ABC transport system permease protein
MAEELRFHIESRSEHLQRQGVPAAEASRRAQLEFGGRESYKELCREALGFRGLDELRSDFRYALRSMRKVPGFTLLVVLSLAASIGVNLSCFASLYAMVLHPFAYHDLDRILTVSDIRAKSTERNPVAPANYLDWKQMSRSFQYLAAYREWDANVSRVAHPDHVQAALTTAELFPVLGIQPLLGRIFTVEECKTGRDAVVVVSQGFWKMRLHSSPDAIGKALSLNGRLYTVVGVMPDEFSLPLGTEVWAPLAFSQREATDRLSQQLSVIGKLRPGVNKRQASAEMNEVARQLEQQYPTTNELHRVIVSTLAESMTAESGHFLSVLMLAALFVLLLGSINVGSLQLARAVSRQKEFGLRGALGANAWRIFRQLLTENILIGVAAGIVGLCLATWHLSTIRASIPPSIYQAAAGLKDMRIDWHVALYGVILSLIVGVLCCLPAAWEATRSSQSGGLNEMIKDGGRSSPSFSVRRGMRKMLVVGEVALAFVLLVAAGLMVATFRKITTLDLGYDTRNLITGKVALSGSEYQKSARVVSFYEGILRTMDRSKDAEASAVVGDLGPANSVFIEGREQVHSGELRPGVFAASAEYLRAMRLPLQRGRWISERDDAQAPRVVVLSESVVRSYWPHSDPLGQKIRLGSADSPWLTVVGVTGDVKDWFLDKPQPAAYVSFRQYPTAAMEFLVKGKNDWRRLAGSLRSVVQRMDREQPVYDVHTMEQEMHEETTGVRNAANMMGTYAGIALLLAAMGIYSINSFFVVQRTPEISIRMSLGASRRSILGMVLGQSCRLTGWGLAVGVPLAVLLTLAMSRALYGLVPVQPGVFLMFVALLSAVALVAGYVPAYRATKVDPVRVLRQE